MRRLGHPAQSRPGDGGAGDAGPVAPEAGDLGEGTWSGDLGGGLRDLLEGEAGDLGAGVLRDLLPAGSRGEGGDVGVVFETRGPEAGGQGSSGTTIRGSMRGGTEIWVVLYWDHQRAGHLEGELREGMTWRGGYFLTREEGRAWGGHTSGLARIVTGLRLVGDRRPVACGKSPKPATSANCYFAPFWGKFGLGASFLLPTPCAGVPRADRVKRMELN